MAAALALTTANGAEVNVYAAASLTDVLKEIAVNYEKQSSDKILFNFGASSLLARQIIEHAPANIFFSADEAKMDDVQKAGLIVTETRRDLLSNSLVIVVPNDSNLVIPSPDQLVDKTQKIAIADPRAVPAGIYTKKYLSRIGLWEKLEPKMVPTENVRAALAAVESGNVDAGFVYKTDANISEKLKIAFSVPIEKGPVIRYPVAIIKRGQKQRRGGRFSALSGIGERAKAIRAVWVYRKILAMWPTPAEWQIVGFTLVVCALSTLIILPLGLAVAWPLARCRWPGKVLVETLVTLPLVLPPVATGLLLLKLLSRGSGIGRFLHEHLGLDIVFTWRAVVAAAAVMSFPLLVRSARVGFQTVNQRFEQIARTLGAGDARVFFTITLPLASRGIIAGIVLAFARAVGEFGATIMVAGNIPGRTTTLSLEIFETVQLGT